MSMEVMHMAIGREGEKGWGLRCSSKEKKEGKGGIGVLKRENKPGREAGMWK